MNQLVKVGKIARAHGIKGELFVLLDEYKSNWPEFFPSTVYLANNETLEFKSISSHKNGFIVKSSQISTRNDSENYENKEIYLPKEIFETQNKADFFLSELLNFEVLDGELLIGKIIGFDSNGIQDLIEMDQDGKKYLIPFIEEFLVNIDFENKKLYLDLPEGLNQL